VARTRLVIASAPTARLGRRWLEQRPLLVAHPRYVEVRLEDAGDAWPTTRPAVLARLGLPDHDGMLGFDLESVRHRDTELTPAERDLVMARLGDIRELLGYGDATPRS
jgi:hypothetical protein